MPKCTKLLSCGWQIKNLRWWTKVAGDCTKIVERSSRIEMLCLFAVTITALYMSVFVYVRGSDSTWNTSDWLGWVCVCCSPLCWLWCWLCHWDQTSDGRPWNWAPLWLPSPATSAHRHTDTYTDIHAHTQKQTLVSWTFHAKWNILSKSFESNQSKQNANTTHLVCAVTVMNLKRRWSH